VLCPCTKLIGVELDHVEAFLAIVRHGGFTRAASALHLSQPATSRRIQLLERELGAPLFERIPAGVVLTEAGRAFLPHAEALLASLRDGIDAVEAVRGTRTGTVALALVGTLASTGLAEQLQAFRDAHPDVDVRLRTALSMEVSALVRRGDATLGLRYEADPDPALVSTPVREERLVPVCAPGHPLAGTRRVTPAMLAAERWLAFPPRAGSAPEPYATALVRRLAASGVDAPEILPIDSLTAQKRMVEAGFGLGLMKLCVLG
jgi:DNA-binding transcriptional LysR family regulator